MFKIKGYCGPGSRTGIMLLLRRTLVRSACYSATGMIVLFLFIANTLRAQNESLYKAGYKQQQTRWSSPENRNGKKGMGGMENNGGKGHPSDIIEAGAADTLLQVNGPGIINRIWITVDNRTPEMLRSLKIEMYWDDAAKPAVSVPFGDFFGLGFGKTIAFENALFASPEARSFECFIPMPFKKSAKILVVNDSKKQLGHIFFDVDYSLLKEWSDDYMYFHAYWHRDTATKTKQDFELLPKVTGGGRYLGVNVSVNGNPLYDKPWWGEGEAKIFLDDDKQYPTLAGTGTEDYLGTGWGQSFFINRYTGCTIANDSMKQWSFYRLHIPDPVFFNTACKVTLQQLGGDMREHLIELQKKGVEIIPATGDVNGKFPDWYKQGVKDLNALPEVWIDYFRSDDVSAVAYFYLDKPASNLPALQPVNIRTYNLK